ncbi:hypothetical protein SLEP1_g16623 [Rubroshorea leprosula]|uniref:Uncharacterized protein n=1 Tax=Rubroshorea leprosula TaxID=152421 RepID=A0AAV5IXB1_9ROSI|nr:hypothetical protein SLEP1_g16623 [Rubroshorea leprosula]
MLGMKSNLKVLVSSSDSSYSDQESSRETSDSYESTEKQKPAEERHPDEEDSGCKDAGKGKRKSEEKRVPEDDTASKDAPNHAEKQRSGEQCQLVNPKGHFDAGKKTPLMINSSKHKKSSAAIDSNAFIFLKKSSSQVSRKYHLESESDQRRSRSKWVRKESNEENVMKLF